MKPAIKTLLCSAGWLAALFIACTAHADESKPHVSWFLAHYEVGATDFNLRSADNDEHTFRVGKAVCVLSEVSIGEHRAARTLTCLENSKVVVDLGLRCAYDTTSARNAVAELHGKQLELVCSVDR
jgi:hypothetical protein